MNREVARLLLLLAGSSVRTSGQTLTTLYSFTIGSDGLRPIAGLVQGSDGNFYGTTFYGGASDNGTVFQMSMLLNPLPNQIARVQVAGASVVITIPSVAGQTYQLQYRDAMSATNWTNVIGGSITNSIGGPIALTDPGGASQPQRFYRIVIAP